MEYNINGTLWYGSKDPNDSDYCGRGCYWRVDGDTLITKFGIVLKKLLLSMV